MTIRHVVSWKLATGDDRERAEQAARIKSGLESLPAVIPELRSAQEYLGSAQPVLMDWAVGLVFPCQQPMLHANGVAQIPNYRISPDFPAKLAQAEGFAGRRPHYLLVPTGAPLPWYAPSFAGWQPVPVPAGTGYALYLRPASSRSKR